MITSLLGLHQATAIMIHAWGTDWDGIERSVV